MKFFDKINNFLDSYLTPLLWFIVISFAVLIVINSLSSSTSASNVVFDNFEIVCDSDNQIVYRCVNTDVLYLWSKSGYAGGLTVMYNSDGTVLTYDKWLEYESLR